MVFTGNSGLNTKGNKGNSHVTLAGDRPKQEYRIRVVLLGPISYFIVFVISGEL